ncbi:MAG: hypothetical protein LBB56_05615 [Chitinispirillales bacterium]|nr:hypothetical protein [Chitinispirillales bacterium]
MNVKEVDSGVKLKVKGVTLRPRMKFCNGDVSLDEAVADIRNSSKKFTPSNTGLLIRAVRSTVLKWESDASESK